MKKSKRKTLTCIALHSSTSFCSLPTNPSCLVADPTRPVELAGNFVQKGLRICLWPSISDPRDPSSFGLFSFASPFWVLNFWNHCNWESFSENSCPDDMYVVPPPQRSDQGSGSGDLRVYQAWKGSNVSFTSYLYFWLFASTRLGCSTFKYLCCCFSIKDYNFISSW